MGYSDLYFWYLVFLRLTNFIGLLIGVSIFFSVIFCIYSFYLCMEKEDEKEKINIILKRGLRSIIMLILFMFIFNIVPKGSEFVTYISLKTVDNYAKNNPNSISNPQVVIKTVDDISNLSIKLLKTIDKSMNLIDKKIEKQLE